jgi:hypothetical protein
VRGGVLMRVMFWTYTVLIALGLAFYITIGLIGQ